ncbi:MAG: hypothetical protein M1814_002336 [Vezdaea aestivalis]|nr:MAG: hypothetical protein M1814_002336 [Vezdaea aestivalis]
MPGHLGRMRPIKRHRSQESDKLEFPVVVNGRAGPGISSSSSFYNPHTRRHPRQKHMPHIITFRRLMPPMSLVKAESLNARNAPSSDPYLFANTTRDTEKPFGAADYYQQQAQQNSNEVFTSQHGKPSSEDSSSQEVPLSQGACDYIHTVKDEQEPYEHPAGPSNGLAKPTDAEILAAKQENLRWELAHVDEDPVDHSKMDYRGWADKGRDLLFGRKKKSLR